MQIIRKKLAVLATLMMILLTLGGCAHFDCSGYIQAMLDSLYKGEHDAYATITKLTSDELEQNYQEGINAEIEKFLSYMNISDNASFVDENTRTNLRSFFQKVYQNANYTVAEADKKGNVKITIQPIQIFTPAKEALDAYVNDFFARNDAGEFAELSDEAFYSQYIQGALDILNTYANTISYGDAITITVAVTSNEQHVYSITDEAFDSIDEHILDYNSQISTSDDSTTQNNTETQNK
jgi:hypothetical protein